MVAFLQARLQPFITQPDAPQVLHPIFVPLDLVGHFGGYLSSLLPPLRDADRGVPLSQQMVKTTGGPALGASVVSPAMTDGAVSLLQEHLTHEEKQLWKSLGDNWTLPRSVC